MTKEPWQSNAIAATQAIFGLSLLPTLLNSHAQVSRLSSGITAMGLFTIAAVYATTPIRMTRAIAMAYLCGLAWTFIFLFRPIA